MAFAADIEQPVLEEGDAHHLVRVLRMRAGDPLTVADGAGRWRTAVLDPSAPTSLAGLGPVTELSDVAPTLAIGFALVKGDKPELIVQKLTELGIDRIVPFRAERSVVRWDDAKAVKAVERLRTVARAAAMQCHRPRLPVVDDVADLADLVAAGAALADRTGEPVSLRHPFVLVGPEGGWSPAEAARPGPRVLLGVHVLRAETAALAAGVLLSSLRVGRIGQKD
jgi:16S rRNA (uracil1498-N3)-methyltransferase